MTAVEVPARHRTVLTGVSWATYEALLADHADRRSPRFTYNRGVLEIVTLGSLHENLIWLFNALVLAVCEARRVDVTGLGSNTFKDEAWERGFEPDACWFLRHAPEARSIQRYDPRRDPRPEIVLEVDVTSSSIDKLPIFAQFEIDEVWRHERGRVRILLRDGDRYVEAASSRTLPGLDADALTGLLAEGRAEPIITWLPRVRAWALGTA